MAYQVKTDGEVVAEFDSKEQAIEAAKAKRPAPRWTEVRDTETGYQIFSEHEFEHDDHITRAQGLIRLLKGSDSGLPPQDVLDHLARTTSTTETVLLTLPGRNGYAGVSLSEWQCIAEPTVKGCNRHFFVLVEGYAEGYRADLYASRAEALEALTKRLGTSSIPVSALF